MGEDWLLILILAELRQATQGCTLDLPGSTQVKQGSKQAKPVSTRETPDCMLAMRGNIADSSGWKDTQEIRLVSQRPSHR